MTNDPLKDASFWFASGQRHLQTGALQAAIESYAKCIALDSQNVAAYNNLAIALIGNAQFAEAIVALERALVLRPGYARALVNIGKALRQSGKHPEAIMRLREALLHDADYVPALINLGDALAAVGEISESLRVLRRAAELAPTLAEAHSTLGIVLLQSGDQPQALQCLRRAVTLAPENGDAHSNLAHAYCVAGDWLSAWPHFEFRLKRRAQRAPLQVPAGVARWDGESEHALWLIAEQGLGDQIQFARYAKCLSARSTPSVLLCHPRLVALLSQAQLGVQVREFGSVPASVHQVRAVPLMSLPLWHATTTTSVPLAASYLRADAGRVERWRHELGTASQMRVGLVWAGNLSMESGLYQGRSPGLAALAPLFELDHMSFISLQMGAGAAELESSPFSPKVRVLKQLDEGNDAFLDTAAVLQCIDVLITSDTATAHVAGALGIPTWLCLMHRPDWRWEPASERTPWYETVRVFRQPAPGDWLSVFRKVRDALIVRAGSAV